jgi:hypothetical protein
MDGITILAGVDVPTSLPAEVLRALERVEIVTAIGERGSFRLSFRLERGATLPEQFLLDSGALVRVVVSTPAGGARPVVMDGVIVAHTVSGRGHDSTLTIDGEDLTLLMDLDDTVVRTFAGTPVVARVLSILAAYAPFGVTPRVVPPPLTDVVLPTDRIFHQEGTDYAFVRRLAEQVGYRFTLDPGPTPAASVAYWGPEPSGDRRHPSLVIDMADPDRHLEHEGLRLRFDALQRLTPQALILEPLSKVAIPVPPPDIAVLTPPLGAVVPPAHRRRRLRVAAKLTATQAAGALLTEAARSAEAMTGVGTLAIGGTQQRVRAGDVVEVKGVAKPFAGLFAVSRTRDSITPHRHTQEFELLRAGIGAAQE